jgi:hypothetical protein
MSFVAVAIGGAAVIGGAATIISSNRQASAAESTAAANADATRAQAAALMHQADAGLEAAKITGQAGIEASKNSMKAAITAAALGQTQTTDTVQHLSPVQLGANAIASYDMALKWNKFMALTEQGYQPGAKNWLLAGKDGKVLYKDPTYNLLAMGQQVKDASLSAMNLVGVKSAANPYGVNLSFDQYKVMMAMKHPEDMLEPSAADKAAYQSRFNAWAASHPMEAALLKDPQQNLHDQLGDKSPIQVDNNGNVTGGTYEGQGHAATAASGKQGTAASGLDPSKTWYEPSDPAARGPGWQISYEPKPGYQVMNGDERAYSQAANPWNPATEGDYKPATSAVANSGKYANWDKAVKAGYVNKDGMIDMGAVMASMPPDLLDPPEFSTVNKISPEQEKQYREQYDQYSNVQLDPKLVSLQNKGYGVQQITVKNADGTIAGQYLQGMLRDAQGQQHNVTIAGTTLHEWDDFQAQADNMGPGWVGMARSKRGGETPGGMEAMGSSLDGMPKLGPPGTMGGMGEGGTPAAYNSFNPYQSSTNGANAPEPVPNVKPSASTPAGSLGTSLGPIGGLDEGGSVPSGYSGAPLAAGG